MEPQLFSCGLLYMSIHIGAIRKASMEPQLFSCGLRIQNVPVWQMQESFNGAATFQLRIAQKFRGIKKGTFLLQWSRNFSVADCSANELLRRKVHGRFNGAATFQLRIANIFFVIDYDVFPWLQWSRNFSVADWRLNSHLWWNRNLLLQWSRNFSVADCNERGIMEFDVILLQWSRNFSVADCSWE